MNTPDELRGPIDIQMIEDCFIRTGCEFDEKGHWIKVTDAHRLYNHLLSLIQEREQTARIDELTKVVALPGHYSTRDYDAHCNKRITELTKETS